MGNNIMLIRSRRKRFNSFKSVERRGIVLVLAAALMVSVMAFAALVVDLGFILVVRSQMQTAADAAALAAGGELADGYGPGAIRTQDAMMTKAKTAGESVASANSMLDRATAYLDPSRDLAFGKRSLNSDTGKWDYEWGVGPYTVVKATIHRDQNPSNASVSVQPDGALNLFFARALGNKTASYKSTAIAALKPGVGVRIAPGSSATCDVLPIALDQQTWIDLLAGTGTDNYSYDPTTGTVSAGSDGILEVNIYPTTDGSLPPGNRGTVDFGSCNNSTADLSRQIRYGLNSSDLSHFANNELNFESGPMIINGDTGISAGIKDDLAYIIGKTRAMPLFTAVAGPGNNAMYTIPKLVGIRLMYVKLTGSPTQKKVIVQPATFVSRQVITSNTEEIQPDSIFSPVRLVQ